MAPNVRLLFSKTKEKQTFLEVTLEKSCKEKSRKNFTVKFGEIRAKILRPPTFACSYTYAEALWRSEMFCTSQFTRTLY